MLLFFSNAENSLESNCGHKYLYNRKEQTVPYAVVSNCFRRLLVLFFVFFFPSDGSNLLYKLTKELIYAKRMTC